MPSPNGARTDEYYWLRDDTRADPAVLAHLQAEDDSVQAMLAPSAALRKRLVAEMRGRIQEDDTDVPVRDDGWWYYERYATGQEHPIHCRRRGSMDAPEQVDGRQPRRQGRALRAAGGRGPGVWLHPADARPPS